MTPPVWIVWVRSTSWPKKKSFKMNLRLHTVYGVWSQLAPTPQQYLFCDSLLYRVLTHVHWVPPAKTNFPSTPSETSETQSMKKSKESLTGKECQNIFCGFWGVARAQIECCRRCVPSGPTKFWQCSSDWGSETATKAQPAKKAISWGGQHIHIVWSDLVHLLPVCDRSSDTTKPKCNKGYSKTCRI